MNQFGSGPKLYTKRRGAALLFTLSVGAFLILLAVSLLGLYASDSSGQGQQQQRIQAYWLARAGIEHYTDSRQLPSDGVYDFGSEGKCSVSRQGEDLLFVGKVGKQQKSILLQKGDPGRKVESNS